MTFEKMIGKTMVSVENTGKYNEDELRFIEADTGITHKFYHPQSCCEHVRIEDVCGDLSDLVGVPILMAEEVDSKYNETCSDTEQWTFYKFSTVKGSVTVRWYGSSNGYYSTSVSYSCD